MKKRFYLVFILILFSINYIFSQNKITLILQPTFGISIYDNGEYIFSPSGKRLVSYLEWKASPLFQIGLNAEVMYKNFEVEFEGQIGIPNECGQMLDSDWISSGVKTTYSIHSNNSVKNYEFYSAIGYRIPIKKFDITPRFLFYYSDDSFYAHDGYGWYGGYAYSKNGKDNSWDSDFARKAEKL